MSIRSDVPTPRTRIDAATTMKVIETRTTFREGTLSITGEEHHLRYFAELAKDAEGTVGDLRYQIEYYYDIDGIRTQDEG